MKAAVFPEERSDVINPPARGLSIGPGRTRRSSRISGTGPGGGAGAQVFSQQADGHAGLLDGSRQLEAQSGDGLRETEGLSGATS